jgi:hypothetical protein
MNQYNSLFTSSVAFLPLITIGTLVLALWSLFWKGCALWIAAKNNKKWWFFAILIFNTVGILEIIYIFFVAKKKWKDIKEIFSKQIPQ